MQPFFARAADHGKIVRESQKEIDRKYTAILEEVKSLKDRVFKLENQKDAA